MLDKGRRLWDDRSADGLHRATLLFERAVEKGPNSAEAHSALADAYAFDSIRSAKAASLAQRAIELDPTLSQPHATLGFIELFWNWSPAKAESYLKRAIALDPDNATAHQWYATVLLAREGLNEALIEIETARALKPDSIAINVDACRVIYYLQRLDAAEAQCKRALSIAPGSFDAHQLLYEIHTSQGRHEDAVDAFFRSEGLTINNTIVQSDAADLRNAFETQGIRAFWQKVIDLSPGPTAEKEMNRARYYALLGDRGATVRGLRLAFERRRFGHFLLRADPVFRPYFDDPELAAAVRAAIDEYSLN